MRTLILVALAGLAGCSKEEDPTPCDVMCEDLVLDCELGAYPDLQSCVDGCLYAEEQGADIPNQMLCVSEAACDTFEIIECEHEYGQPEGMR